MKMLLILVVLNCGFLSIKAFAQNVGIGTNTPGAKLEVNGNIKIDGGSPVTGRVLTSVDGTGLAEWQDIPSTSHIGFKTYLSSNAAIPSFTATKINFDVSSFNDGNGFNIPSGNFIVPAPGLYYFHASLTMMQPVTVNPTVIRINSNGSLIAQSSNAVFQTTVSYNSTIEVSLIEKLNTGDAISVSVLTYGSSTVSNYFGSTFFEGYKVY